MVKAVHSGRNSALQSLHGGGIFPNALSFPKAQTSKPVFIYR